MMKKGPHAHLRGVDLAKEEEKKKTEFLLLSSFSLAYFDFDAGSDSEWQTAERAFGQGTLLIRKNGDPNEH
jgi:hypothetical protein